MTRDLIKVSKQLLDINQILTFEELGKRSIRNER